MKKLFLSVVLLFSVLLCGCAGDEVGEGRQTDSETVDMIQSQTDSIESETLPEIPNDPDDGYSKRY